MEQLGTTFLRQNEDDDDDSKIVPLRSARQSSHSKNGKSNYLTVVTQFLKIPQNRNMVVSVGLCLAMFFLYASNWGSGAVREEKVEVKQEVKTEIPPYEEGVAISSEYQSLVEHQTKMISFFKEEQQNKIIQLAIAFQTAATSFTQFQNHICSGKTVTACLETFKESRLKTLRLVNSSNPPAFNYSGGNARLDKIHQTAIAEDELLAISLAIAINNPADVRSQSEQELINQFAGRLNSGYSATDLSMRPLTLVSLYQEEKQLQEQIEGIQGETQISIESCFALSEKEQKERGGCLK